MKFRIRPSRLSVLALCCALALNACTMWEEHSGPAPAAARPIRAVRLTLADGSAVVLEHAVVRGDSIVGSQPGTTAEAGVALADVTKTEIQRIDPAATFWTGALGFAAGFFGFLYWAFHSGVAT